MRVVTRALSYGAQQEPFRGGRRARNAVELVKNLTDHSSVDHFGRMPTSPYPQSRRCATIETGLR